MMRKLIARINSYRNLDNLSFTRYLDVLKHNGAVEEACEIEISYPEYLMMNYPSMSYRDISKMSWGEVKVRLRVIAKKQLTQAEMLERMIMSVPSPSVLGEKYGNVIINKAEWK